MIYKEGLLEDKVAVITGGGTGIGREIALVLSGLGASVIIASRHKDNLEPTAEKIQNLGGKVLPVICDVRDFEQVQHMVDQAVDAFGHIDVLVNNAAGNFLVRAEDLTPNGWNAVVDIVLKGTFFCIQAVGKQMIKQKTGGSILSIVATYVEKGGPYTSHSASAKAGVVALTKSLASEWARHNIRLNTIAPGPIQTKGASSRLWAGAEAELAETIPLKRFGKPEEIACLVVYLCSEAAQYITGTNINIDGGGSLGKSEFSEELIDLLREQTKKSS